MSLAQSSNVQSLVNMFLARDQLWESEGSDQPRFPPSVVNETLSKQAASPGQDLSKRLDVTYEFIDDAIILQNLTELSFKVPENTTLIRVLGPVGIYDKAYRGSQCYAAVDPPPAWWRNDSFPLSASWKMVNETNRTMFLLPVDPEVRSTLKVGTLGLDSTCFISGISSYPFH